MTRPVTVICVGDVFGEPGRRAVQVLLPKLRKQYEADVTVVNVENSAAGFGVTPQIARTFLDQGVDVMTSGNHIWDKKEIIEYIVKENLLLRPANYPSGTPGVGSAVVKAGPHKVAVLNLMGRVFLPSLDCPFRKADEEVARLRQEAAIIVVDMHCEATSESQAMGWYLDGRVSAVVGTHRHVQTADERVLPQGTAFITDLGMTGPVNSVIGVDPELAIGRFLSQMPNRFEPAKGPAALHGAVIRIDPDTARALSIERLERPASRLTDLQILDGRAVAAKVLAEVKAGAAALTGRTGVAPTLAVVLVGDFAPSQMYVRSKKRTADEVGIASRDFLYPQGCSREELLATLRAINADPTVHGVLLQLPLPDGMDEDEAVSTIDPAKDVDGLHPMNLGRLLAGTPVTVPCTPAGCLEILDQHGIELRGAEAVVVGRSRLVGKPLAQLLLGRHATVTTCHTRTRDLAGHCRRADVLCVAAGRPGVITGDMVKDGAVVIDVGVNRLEGGKLAGDVDFASVSPKVRAITPVPGGVGPTTIAMLMRNTLLAAQRQLGAAPERARPERG